MVQTCMSVDRLICDLSSLFVDWAQFLITLRRCLPSHELLSSLPSNQECRKSAGQQASKVSVEIDSGGDARIAGRCKLESNESTQSTQTVDRKFVPKDLDLGSRMKQTGSSNDTVDRCGRAQAINRPLLSQHTHRQRSKACRYAACKEYSEECSSADVLVYYQNISVSDMTAQ